MENKKIQLLIHTEACMFRLAEIIQPPSKHFIQKNLASISNQHIKKSKLLPPSWSAETPYLRTNALITAM
jgi:hypothetical protein